jgi:hypothetical protein
MKNVAIIVAGALAVPFAAAAQASAGTAGQSSSVVYRSSTAIPPYPIATGSNTVQSLATGVTPIGTGAASSSGVLPTGTGATPVGPTRSSGPPPSLGAGSKNAASGLVAGGVAVMAAIVAL